MALECESGGYRNGKCSYSPREDVTPEFFFDAA